ALLRRYIRRYHALRRAWTFEEGGMQNTNGSDDRVRAYAAGAQISKEKMAREAPLEAAALEAVEAADIVVVEGCYDHVERVLDALELPYQRVSPGQLEEVP